MATGQTILDVMEVMARGLQLQSGETGVTFALRAANVAQDHLESILATEPNSYGAGVGTVTTAASTETTTFPSGLLRLDRLQYLDASTSRPAWDLDWVGYTGDQNELSALYVLLGTNSDITGKPRRYWTNGTNIYWGPLPNATHTVRYYGLTAADDITASGTFAYPDIAIAPVAEFASRMLKIGKDDAHRPAVQPVQPRSGTGLRLPLRAYRIGGHFMARGQFQTQSSISSNTDTSLIAAPGAGQTINVLWWSIDVAAAGAGSLLRLEDGAGGDTLLRKGGATLNDRTFEWFAMDGLAIHGLQLTENTALSAETSTSDGTATWVINVAYEVR